MTALHGVALTASCSHLFTSSYGEFTCGNATVTATEAAVGGLSTVTANYLDKSPISAEIDPLSRALLSYPQGSPTSSRGRHDDAGNGDVDPPRPPRPLPVRRCRG
jgi:hypothetical protein